MGSSLFSWAAPSGASARRWRLFLQLPGWFAHPVCISGGWPLSERVWCSRGSPPPCGSQPGALPTCLLRMVQSRPVCLSACLCSFQATALSPFSRTAVRVLRGAGGGKRSGRHLSCSQPDWKCTVSSVLIRRCLNHPQGQLSICEDQTMTCVGSTVSVVVRMSFSSLPQIHIPLCPSFPTWTLSSFPPDTPGF